MCRLIGILGGTFDPIHFGHLRSAMDVMQAVGLDQVRFIPNNTPPHRQQPWLNSDTRKQLIEMAIADVPQFLLDDRELERSGPSFMVDTLRDLKHQFADDSLCLIMGMDAFAGFTRWHQWQSILELCNLIVVTRPGTIMFDQDEAMFGMYHGLLQDRLITESDSLKQRQHGQILLQSTILLDISSTQIRELLGRGQSIQYLLPDNVREFLSKQYAI